MSETLGFNTDTQSTPLYGTPEYIARVVLTAEAAGSDSGYEAPEHIPDEVRATEAQGSYRNGEADQNSQYYWTSPPPI